MRIEYGRHTSKGNSTMTTAVSEKPIGAVAVSSLCRTEILGKGGVMAVLQQMQEANGISKTALATLQQMREAQSAYTAFRKRLADIQAAEDARLKMWQNLMRPTVSQMAIEAEKIRQEHLKLTEAVRRLESGIYLRHQPPQTPVSEPPQAKSPISESLSAPPEPLFLIDGKAVSEAEYRDWAVSEHYRKIGQKGNYTRGEVKRQIIADFIQENREFGTSKNQFAAERHKRYDRTPATIRNILKKVTV